MVDFKCPKCKASLFKSDSRTLMLKGVLRGSNFSAESMFELNHQQDAFGGKPLAANLLVEKGARVDFFCPHCGYDLTLPEDPELAEISLVEEGGEERSFLFSKIAGKEMSFLLHKKKKEVLGSYGKDHADYLNRIHEFFHIWNRF